MLRAFSLIPLLLPALWAQTASTFVASAGYSFPDLTPVARGQVITLFVHGLQVPNAKCQQQPLANDAQWSDSRRRESPDA